MENFVVSIVTSGQWYCYFNVYID